MLLYRNYRKIEKNVIILNMKTNTVYYKNAQDMGEIPDGKIDLILTSPPYYNVKNYAKNGHQNKVHSERNPGQIGDIEDYSAFILELSKIWTECERILSPNGKLVVNAPLMPMLKDVMNTHYNRHIFDLNADIQQSILRQAGTKMFLYDMYIWNRVNSSKKMMFGSYPHPCNFYAQNTSEFVTVYVKDGASRKNVSASIKSKSKLTKEEWMEYTKQIWNIPAPGRGDLAFGEHAAIMPEEIVRRCVRLFTFSGDVVLDPFAGSGTTLKVAQELGRKYIGYEIMSEYKRVIDKKLKQSLLAA